MLNDGLSPWEPGRRVSAQREMEATRKSTTSRWIPTVCQVSVTEAFYPYFFVLSCWSIRVSACLIYISVCMCVSVVSVSIDEDGGHNSSSEEATDTHSTSSSQAVPSSPSSSSSNPTTSASTPLDMPCPYPTSSLYTPHSYISTSPSFPILSSSCPEGLESVSPFHDPDSVCGSGHASPLLGPRSQCSGASSPDCDQERGVCS